MPTVILKASDNLDDFYVLWSTVVDAPVAWGDRKFLKESVPQGMEDDRFDRADRTGTSCFLGTGEWDNTMSVHNLGNSNRPWALERGNLLPFITALDEIQDGDKDGEEEILQKYAEPIVYED